MKKVFVSHSSQDKEVVDLFIDKILKLGLAFTSDDIAYTSRQDTGVKTGDDIKKFIKENISTCDFVFFMISGNYADSKICLNEMGAAWATERRVIPVVFPNIDFFSIGWLYNDHKGIKLDESSALDTIFEEINEKYGHKLKISSWNIYKTDFLNGLKNKCPINEEETNLPVIIPEVIEELDLLDCRERFNEGIAENTKSTERISAALSKQTEKMALTTRNLTNINSNINSSPAQVRNIMQKAAHDNDELSDVYDVEIPIIKAALEKTTYYGIKMREISPLEDADTIKEERDAISVLIEEMQGSLASLVGLKATFEEDKTLLDKTYNRSKKRLLVCLEQMIEVLNSGIEKVNELLNRT
jgi:hypothetical protein